MRCKTCLWIGGTALFVSGMLLLVAESGIAGGDEEKKQQEVNAVVKKIRTAVKNGDKKTTAALVSKLSKAQLKEEYPLARVMKPLAIRATGGFGIGNKPNAVKQDGAWLWLKLNARVNPPKAVLKDHKADLIEMAWLTRAVAEITLKTVAPFPDNARNRKLWIDMAQNMKERSTELVKAFEKGEAKAIQSAIVKLNDTCDRCHAEFK